MKILYIITTYSPRDNNKNYFKYTGYPYQTLNSVLNIKSQHSIDVVVSDCASGPRTRDFLLKFRDINKFNNLKFLFGADNSGFISINKACMTFNKNYEYDYVFFSVSDAILQNPDNFDAMIDDFSSDGCNYCYLDIKPGLELPKAQINQMWYSNMSMNDSVHHNGFCVKKKFTQFYENRLIPDVMDGTFETLLGYYCAASGTWRKISSYLQYLHLPKTGVRTDRKTAYVNKNLCRGDSWFFPMSQYSKRNFVSILKTKEANSAGIHFNEQKNIVQYLFSMDKYHPLPEDKRQIMEQFVRRNFFLTPEEFSYEGFEVQII